MATMRSTAMLLPAMAALALAVPARAQQPEKSKTEQELAWLAYKITYRFNERWSANMDAQERMFTSPVAQHQMVFRPTATRTLGPGWDVGLGFCYFLQSPHDPLSTSDLVVPELRPHIEFNLKQKARYFRISHRYKAEARYFHEVENGELEGGYAFSNFRLRYRIGLDLPLIKSKQGELDRLGLTVSDELMVNAGSRIVQNVFDQNRVYIGLYAAINPGLTLEVGYTNWFQQRPSGSDFYDRHILRIGVNQKFGGKKKAGVPNAG
jgi:hypothetical protein